jgi:hypothetical protein
MRNQSTYVLLAVMLLASALSAHGARYGGNRRLAHKVPAEATQVKRVLGQELIIANTKQLIFYKCHHKHCEALTPESRPVE